MVKVNTVQELFIYINRFGFSGGGSIYNRQMNLAEVADKIMAPLGGYHNTFPFRIRYVRKDKTFHVHEQNGTIHLVKV